MMKQYLAIPRMHTIYTFLETKTPITTFDPFLVNGLENSHNIYKVCASDGQDGEGADPLLRQDEARHYYADLKRMSLEHVGTFSKENIHLSQMQAQDLADNKGVLQSHASSFLSEEAKALENFYTENSSRRNLQTASKDAKPRHILQEKERKSFSLADLQKFLLLAYLQEEQDRELFLLNKIIEKQGEKVQSFLHNPLEKEYFSDTSSSLSPLKDEANFEAETVGKEFSDTFLDKLLAKEEEVLESFAFNIYKEKKKSSFSLEERSLKGCILQKEEEESVPFTSSWKEIFSAQIPFIKENTLLFVNDMPMNRDLLSLAKSLKKKWNTQEEIGEIRQHFRFDEDMQNAEYKEEFLKNLQCDIKNVKSQTLPTKPLFSYFSCSMNDILDREKFFFKDHLARAIRHKSSSQILHFILLQK